MMIIDINKTVHWTFSESRSDARVADRGRSSQRLRPRSPSWLYAWRRSANVVWWGNGTEPRRSSWGKVMWFWRSTGWRRTCLGLKLHNGKKTLETWDIFGMNIEKNMLFFFVNFVFGACETPSHDIEQVNIVNWWKMIDTPAAEGVLEKDRENHWYTMNWAWRIEALKPPESRMVS